MIQETLAKIEAQLNQASSLSPERREGLLKLMQELKAEVNGLAETHQDDARSIAGFTDVSTHEATRQERNPELLQHSLDGLAASVASFEKTHPRLFHAVQNVCQTLSNLGI